MPYTKDNPPAQIKNLPDGAQSIWIGAFNSASEKNDEESAAKIAWSAVKNKYEKKGEQWVAKESVDRAVESLLSGVSAAKALSEAYGIPPGDVRGRFALGSADREAINRTLRQYGMNGNGRFTSPGSAYTRAAVILGEYGLLIDTAAGGFGADGTLRSPIYKKGAREGEVLEVSNALLLFQYTQLFTDPPVFEVIAYIS